MPIVINLFSYKNKMKGQCELYERRFAGMVADPSLGDVALYPNPYMTLTPEGYTKHYFAGTERIGTTRGGGNDGNWLVNPLDYFTQAEQDCLNYLNDGTIYPKFYYEFYDYPHQHSQTENTDYTGTVTSQDYNYSDYQYKTDELYLGFPSMYFKPVLSEHLEEYYKQDKGDEPYYYHSDHLGSAAWITDKNGLPVQYIMYAPYGEQLLNQHAGTYDERFKFTGKERDQETGYDYFGARFYLPVFSFWGAVDPLADKSIHNSCYTYCEGNPIKFVDSDGKYAESGWDLFWVVVDVASIVYDLINDDTQQAQLDVACLSTDATALLLPGVPAVSGTARMVSRFASKTDDVSKTTRIIENAKQGREFEKLLSEQIIEDKACQVTIEVADGTRVRVDFITVENGQFKVIEAKSSQTAPLPPNQKKEYPQIQESGGIIKGNNGINIGLPNGTVLEPTEVIIIRPDDINH